ncbi:MAG: ribosome-associated ATPase/putative transporter RbbA [Hyphomonadaceae bacterium]|nr:ribosome-associated ATPase/putative transporter RbbA [Hyphomonadaceae bacterium]
MSEAPPWAARLTGVRHAYGNTPALDDVSLAVAAGEALVVIGPDGVGKSTLLALIAGAKRIQHGAVETLGRDLSQERARAAVQPRIAFMPQGLGRNLYASLSVRENIDYFAALFGGAPSARVEALMDALGLAPFAARAAGKLSGGMKQKLGLCCALVHDPDILILDEPTTGVDPLSRRQFWDLVSAIRAARPAMALIVATSYLDEAERFGRVVLMQAGAIIADGAPMALKAEHGAVSMEALFMRLTGAELAARIARNAPAADAPIAVEAHGLTRRFGAFVAVDQVEFSVRRGEIYGFLGSNGCGKTTTMKMLTGLLPASEGEARMLGRPVDARDLATRRRVGYMSQGFSLYGELTVQQNLDLHAKLFGLEDDKGALRIGALKEQFGLNPHASAIAGALPLGVRQRLSLAIAILHEPEVLILDEPTSGVDPAAREAFWQEIERLARDKEVTIFISTHFMSEAERCDRVAFMHAGRVIAEGAPDALRQSQNAATLEDAFVRYMQIGGAGEPPAHALSALITGVSDKPAKQMPRLLAVARREILEMLREPVRFAMALAGTLVLALAFGYGISFNVEDVSLAVIDRDRTPASRAYVEEFASSPYFELRAALNDDRAVEQALRSNRATLVLDIPPGFGRALASGRAPPIGAWVDGAMPFRAETVSGYALALHQRAIAAAAGGRAPLSAAYELEPRFLYNQAFRSFNAVVPIMIGILLAMIPSILTSLAVVREKELGSITNFYVTPISRTEFLLGKQLPYIALGFVNFLLLVALAIVLFGLSIKGSLIALLLAGLLYVAATSAVGFVSSALTRSQTAAVFGTAIVIMVPAVEFSGLMQPLASLEPVDRAIGALFPTSHFNQISTGVFAKGRGFFDLASELAVLALFWLVLLAISIALLRKQER